MNEKRDIEKEKRNSKISLLISHQEVKKVMISQKNMFIAIPKTLENELVLDSPHCLANLVKKFNDVFQDPPKRLPPIRGIEQQIDFVPVLLYQIGMPIGPMQPRQKKFNNK